ncbi:MAG: carbohydrate binding domain-containing protein [Planctomycetaceae bacterium]|nr:carbohydrate binding domain-containing protein [Planctomycetaceae bacterium]
MVFDGGGVWEHRIPVSITNATAAAWEGKPFSVSLPAAVQNVKDIRAALPNGQELLFAVHSPNGEQILDGALPKDAVLTVPADAEPNETAHFFVYYGNAKAEAVPDYLEVRPGFTNGSFEFGTGNTPAGWFADEDTAGYQNFWIEEKPKDGKKCFKTVIAEGRTPEWFAVRQTNIPVVPNGKYRVSAWVRGENVKGRAGWFLHCGNETNSQTVNRTQGNFEGTFDWKEIVIEFTAPADADRATVGTVLYGSGTAWFDNVQLEQLAPAVSPQEKIEFGTPQTIPYQVIEPEKNFPEVKTGGYLCRSTFRIVNSSDKAMQNVPVLMTLRGTLSHGLLGTLTDLYLSDDGQKFPVQVLDEDNQRIATSLNIPAKTVKYFNVYYKFDGSKASPELYVKKQDIGGSSDTAHPEQQKMIDPFAHLPNKLRNGDFESVDGGFPAVWQRNDVKPPEGVKYSAETDPKIVRFGKRCARLDVGKDVPVSWRGWTQQIPVKANKSYLVQGYLRTENAETVRIHIHFHQNGGKHCANGGMGSINQDVGGTSDWTRLAEVITAPEDAAFMTVHLTMNSSGTLWHDNLSVFDGLFAEQIDRESAYNAPNKITLWQVPAIVKVFPQTIPAEETEQTPFKIEAARNEKEPLQIAVRCNSTEKLHFALSPLKHSNGTEITNAEVNVAGYVPIDYPSNYYNTTVPKWFRKTPAAAPGCDGWNGLWADPLLPVDTVNVKPGQTESVWFTVSVPKGTSAGKYTGKITVSSLHGKTDYPVELLVRDFTLPDENHVSAIYDVRFGRSGEAFWNKPMNQLYSEAVDFMADNRLSPDAVQPPVKVEFKDGQFIFDWTEFDKTAQWLFNEKKIRCVYTPHLFYSFGWGHPPNNFYGEQPYPGTPPFKGADFTKLRPEYKKRYQDCLREFWNHIRQKGWEKRFVLYVSDEPNYWQGHHIIDQMNAVCAMIHEVDADIPIYSSTWHYVPDWKEALDVWGIGHYGIVPVETMKEIKNRGSRIWFTTDGMLCLDTPYSAIERLLPYYCFKYGADAYEFWGVSWFTYNPYERGSHAYIWQSSTPGEYYWVRYPNGDGYLIYPGGPVDSQKIIGSVRFAQAREGVEDFEYFYLLEQLMVKAKQAGKNTEPAEKALAAVKNMVDCPSPIGRYSSKILPNPNRLYEVRRQVAEAVEALSK